MARRGPRVGRLSLAACALVTSLAVFTVAGAEGPSSRAGSGAAAPVSTPLDEALLFPWPAGWSWARYYGWHGSGYGAYALDFSPPRGTPPEAFAVLAAGPGTLSEVCGVADGDHWQSTLRIDHSEGSTLYMHLAAETVPRHLIGQRVQRGQFLGMLYTGSGCLAGDPCEYWTPCGYGTAVHLHFEFPGPDVPVDGYTGAEIATTADGSEWLSHNQALGYTPPAAPEGDSAGDGPSYAAAQPERRAELDLAESALPVGGSPELVAAGVEVAQPPGLSLPSPDRPSPGDPVAGPEPEAPAPFRWQGPLPIGSSGLYRISFYLADAAKLELDGEVILTTEGAALPAVVELRLGPGEHLLSLETAALAAIAGFRFEWAPLPD